MVFTLLIFSSRVYCQQSFTVAGNSTTIQNLKFDYCIGDMVLVSTERGASNIFTQGLLQPNLLNCNYNTQIENTLNSLSSLIKVYPNPTENILEIESKEEIESNIQYQLFDAVGKLLVNESVLWTVGTNKILIDLKNYAAGAYYLMISKPSKSQTVSNFNYKIQKIN